MTTIEENKDLKPYNTFGISATAHFFVSILNENDILQFLDNELIINKPITILGGGSNFLLCNNIKGIVCKIEIPGIETVEENSDYSIIRAGGGIEWDKLVEWTVNNGLGGLENLSHIPGTVGACPVQNIGAYGAEVKDTICLVEGIELDTKRKVSYTNTECNFGYRSSIFKTSLKGKAIITYVSFKLSKKPKFRVEYGSVANELKNIGEPNLKNIRQAIINIRSYKLPDPTEIGNAGSFFKNPVVEASKVEKLKSLFPSMPIYDVSEGFKKIAAAFLIEQCGWKGYRTGDAGVHSIQPLVLVNYGNASGKEIVALAEKIQQSIKTKFDINLEMEVNVVN